MITIRISLSWIDPQPRPLPARGLHHIAEITPHVLARHALSLEQKPDSVQPVKATEISDLFDVMISCLEAALAG
jgi:hypothetical protein